MKNLFLKLTFLFVAAFALVSCDKEEVINVDGLPSASNTFLNEYFAGVKVLSTIKETEFVDKEYKVILENGVEISFDKKGNWTEVEAKLETQALPNTAFILPAITDYIAANYPDAGINGIEKNKNGFDVELTNGFDLEFNANGGFVRFD